MTTLPNPGPLGGPLDGPSRAGASRPRQAAAPERGSAFRAQLAELQDRTASLEEQSRATDRPEALRAAVDAARAALDRAESLGSELLEAYRAGVRVPGSPGASPASSRSAAEPEELP